MLLPNHAAFLEFQAWQKRQRRIRRLARQHASGPGMITGKQYAMNALLFLDDGQVLVARPAGFERQVRQVHAKPEPLRFRRGGRRRHAPTFRFCERQRILRVLAGSIRGRCGVPCDDR